MRLPTRDKLPPYVPEGSEVLARLVSHTIYSYHDPVTLCFSIEDEPYRGQIVTKRFYWRPSGQVRDLAETFLDASPDQEARVELEDLIEALSQQPVLVRIGKQKRSGEIEVVALRQAKPL